MPDLQPRRFSTGAFALAAAVLALAGLGLIAGLALQDHRPEAKPRSVRPTEPPRIPERSAPEPAGPGLPLVEPWSHLDDLRPGTPEGDLAARLDRMVRECEPGRKQRGLATLRVRLDYAAYMGSGAADSSEAAADHAAIAGRLAAQLDEVLAGRDPFAAERGNRLRGYFAANDGSCQPYSLTLPEGFDPAARYPLVLLLHHHGWGDWYRPFQGHPAQGLPGAIVAAPHGRGSCDYLWIAEDDALAVIDAAIADFPVDPARVYVTGWSMGGTGSFHLPGRWPDRFAASCPKAGNADFTAWEEAWKEDRRRLVTPREEPRMFLRWGTAPVTYAENFLHVPISIDHGAADSINPVGHSRSMAGRLKQLGYPNVVFRSEEAGGHGWGASAEERFEWMKQFRRPELPNRVRLKTADYRHGSAYWLTVERLADRMKMAEIDVKIAAPDRIEVEKCENIKGFALRLRGLRLAESAVVQISGQRLPIGMPRPEAVTLTRFTSLEELPMGGRAGEWMLLPGAPPKFVTQDGKEVRLSEGYPPRKRKGLEGPIHDAFRDPFLIVVGTTAADEFERAVVREEAERWRRQWRRRFQCWPPVKDDKDVTDADIAAKNLVLFGGPQANSVTARVNAKLPARIEGKAVVVGEKRYEGEDLGLKLCYPNPLNPERLVILQASTTWRGMWQMSHRFGNWFDWMPLDNRDWFDFCVFDDRSAEFETFLDVGFFDEDWSLARANRWPAVPGWREKAAPREYPKFRSPPADAKEVRLADLWPVQIDTAKGPWQINRSLNGLPLCIGREGQAHGLGQWIESAAVYEIGGAFKTFATGFGIDAEGQEKISDARREVEFVTFQVLGDGRLLAEKRDVRFGDPPGRFELDVAGVRRLTLRVLRQYPQGWLCGPVAWGQPTLGR